jgi:hypothetical protein
MEPEVDQLRRYRDRYLHHRSWGRALVRAYEITSPPVADLIGRSEWLRGAARAALSPVIASVTAGERAGPMRALPVLIGFLVLAAVLVVSSAALLLAGRALGVVRWRNIVFPGTYEKR